MSTSRLSGILNIDKPYGITSMDVVRRIKGASGAKRVGHAGTLDPIATGVIPVCIGQATRVMEYLLDGSKCYVGEVLLGVSTDTYDSMGEVVSEADSSSLTRGELERAVTAFQGEVDQVPPMFSALKQGGKRLYSLAREGIHVERKPRRMTVYGIELTGWEPPVATVKVDCGRGFYMRSLAHDIGEALGCGGHLKSLVRQKTGPFHIDDSVSLEDAVDSFEDGSWMGLLQGADVALESMRSITTDVRGRRLVSNGRPLPPDVSIEDAGPEERRRVYDGGGEFLAIVRFDAMSKQWLPEKVFVAAPRVDSHSRA